MLIRLPLEPSWQHYLRPEFEKPYMKALQAFLEARKKSGKVIYPAENLYFSALNSTPLAQVKVVILGQDPYHGRHQAHGLSFSVPVGERIPPSLRNIYKELQDDLSIPIAPHGYLQHWAGQGVLLLNSVLTVEEANPRAHQDQGWEQFTDVVINTVNEVCEHVVFMLWGSHAQKKGVHIDASKHLVLQAAHPSPLSAHRGFLGCKHFSKANEYLQNHRIQQIDWELPEKTQRLL